MPSILDMAKKIAQPDPDSKEAGVRALREQQAAADDGMTIPDFLKREETPESKKRLDMIRAAAKRVRENPGRYIKNPPNRVSEQAKMLGASPAQLRSTGAKLKSETEQEKDMSTRKSTKAGNSKARSGVKKTAKTTAKKAGNGVRPGSKLEIIANLLKRAQGCTTKEVLAATEWPAVSMPQQAKAAGLKLRKEKKDGVTHYYAA